MFLRHLAGASVFALAIAAGSCAASAETKEIWSLSGFSHPESVDLDVPHQVLYVSDIDRLIEIDTRTAKITNTYPAGGAVFLNDPAVDAKGNIYVSDIAKRKIWKLQDGKMSIWYDGDDLMHVNGMRVIYGGKLLVAGWGRNMKDDGSTDSLGNLFTINLKTKAIDNFGDGRPAGNLDGLERDAHGEFLATDFIAGGLIRIHKDGSFETLVDLAPGSADLDVIDKGHTAIVPRMLEDTVTAYSVD